MSTNIEPLECGLTAFGRAQAAPAQIPALRRKPHEHIKPPTGLLKYVDDQSVVSVAALYQAIHDYGLGDTNFTNWGVVAAPRFLGRETCAVFLDRFLRQGPLCTSPLLAVYQSLHAVSGSLTLALKINGPNMGVGGLHRAIEQTLLTGLAMQCEHRLPGVWMVLSEWDPEPIPSEDCKPLQGGVCRALCMAFTPVAAGWQGLRLRLLPGPAGSAPEKESLEEPTLAQLGDFLTAAKSHEYSSWHCPLSWNARLELTTARRSDVPLAA